MLILSGINLSKQLTIIVEQPHIIPGVKSIHEIIYID